MTKSKHLSDADKKTFMIAMEGVTPYKSDKQPHYQQTQALSSMGKRTSPLVLKHRENTRGNDKPFNQTSYFLSDVVHAEIDYEAFLSFKTPGLQPKTFQQLKSGKIPVDAAIDLHGLYVDQARIALTQFFERALEEQCRCIRIIHGKGYRAEGKKPILKNHVFHWLKQLPNILAFSSCARKDGGTGAVCVLLKRNT